MADIKYFIQDSFSDWMSEDDAISGKNQYLMGENIDVTRDSNIVQLSYVPTLSTTLANAPYNMVEVVDRVSNTTEVVVLSEDNIYLASSSTAVYTDTWMDRLEYPAFVLGGYFYWVENNWPTSAFTINRTTVADAVSASWSPTMAYKTIFNDNYYEYSSYILRGTVAYISLWNKITIFTSTTGDVEYYEDIDDEIVGMASTYAGIMVFTETGKMHLWSGAFGDGIQSTIDLNIKPSKIYQYGTDIYMLWGAQSSEQGLYIFDGQKAIRLYNQKFSRQASEWKYRFVNLPSSITNDRDNIYIIDDGSNYDKIAFYGNKVSGQNKGMHYLNAKNSSGNGAVIRCILFSQGQLYVGWTYSGTHWIDIISSGNNLNTTGYLITSPRDLELGIIRKNNLGLFFRVDDIDANHTIVVSASLDGGTYTTLHTVNTMPKDGIVRISKNMFITAWLLGDFEDYSFKFTLTTNNNTSPKIIKWFVHKYETIWIE